jgi:sugar phosphate isomerase/epimerase
MNQVSFITANYVAREMGFHMPNGLADWGKADQATSAVFRPLEAFAERFDKLLEDVAALGFEAIDLWTAHLNPQWATDQHIASARDLLEKYGFTVTSLAGGFGATPAEFEGACRLAAALGTTVLGGSTSLLHTDRAAVIELLERHGVKLGIENHPAEKTPANILAQIGDSAGGLIGTAVDTGWWGTQGYDAARAIEELGPHILVVHLKDVLAAGAHDTCRYGRGVVPIEGCVRALQRMGYAGSIGVEHEPVGFDPSEDCAAMREMLRGWL